MHLPRQGLTYGWIAVLLSKTLQDQRSYSVQPLGGTPVEDPDAYHLLTVRVSGTVRDVTGRATYPDLNTS